MFCCFRPLISLDSRLHELFANYSEVCPIRNNLKQVMSDRLGLNYFLLSLSLFCITNAHYFLCNLFLQRPFMSPSMSYKIARK